MAKTKATLLTVAEPEEVHQEQKVVHAISFSSTRIDRDYIPRLSGSGVLKAAKANKSWNELRIEASQFISPDEAVVQLSTVELPSFDYNQQLKESLSRYLSSFFRENRELFSGVYQSHVTDNRLHYAIVLREDTRSNRRLVFNVLHEPEIFTYEERCPVSFQFYPHELADKIEAADPIFA